MSPIDVNQAWERSREGSPFSNSTQYEMWDSNWCGRCMRDAPYRADISPTGCPLLLIAFTGRTPAEWLEQPEDSPDDYHCLEFRPRGGRGGPEPRPQPDPPGMDGLFPPPGRAVRMLTQPQPERAPQEATA